MLKLLLLLFAVYYFLQSCWGVNCRAFLSYLQCEGTGWAIPDCQRGCGPLLSSPTMSTNRLSETAPLLPTDRQDTDELTPCESNPKVRGIVWGALTSLLLVALVLLVGFRGIFGDSFAEWLGVLPKDPMLAALAILDKAPVIVRGSLLPCNGERPWGWVFQDGHIGNSLTSWFLHKSTRTAIINIFFY